MKAAGRSTDWISELCDYRRLFIHRSTPWFALEDTGRKPARYEVVILKQNAASLANPTNYIRLAEFGRIYGEFGRSIPVVKRWLIDEIATADATDV